MWFYKVHVESAGGSDYDKRKSTFVDGVAWLDRCREGFENGFGGFKALP